MQVRATAKTPASPLNLTIILFLKSLDPVFQKRDKEVPLGTSLCFSEEASSYPCVSRIV